MAAARADDLRENMRQTVMTRWREDRELVDAQMYGRQCTVSGSTAGVRGSNDERVQSV